MCISPTISNPIGSGLEKRAAMGLTKAVAWTIALAALFHLGYAASTLAVVF